MKSIDRLTVKYHNRVVGILSLTPDDKFCAFEYDKSWLAVSASRHSSYPYVKDYSSPSHSLSMATSAFSRIVCLMVMGAICSTKL